MFSRSFVDFPFLHVSSMFVWFHGPDLCIKLRLDSQLSFFLKQFSQMLCDIFVCSVTSEVRWEECLIISLQRTAIINSLFFPPQIWHGNIETGRQLVYQAPFPTYFWYAHWSLLIVVVRPRNVSKELLRGTGMKEILLAQTSYLPDKQDSL